MANGLSQEEKDTLLKVMERAKVHNTIAAALLLYVLAAVRGPEYRETWLLILVLFVLQEFDQANKDGRLQV